MATLALGAVGNSIFPGVGGFIGATLGAFIDQQFLYPFLFPSKPISGPRIDDRQIQLASEGSDMKFVLGPRNRIAGTVIDKSDLYETVNETSIDTKGGSGVTTKNYLYSVDVAIGLCDTSTLPNGKVNRISKIWAGTKLIYGPGSNKVYDSLEIYLGDQTSPDPTLEALHPDDDIPAYTGTCYIVFKRLALADSGNQLPTITVLVEQAADVSAATAIQILLERAGYLFYEFSVTGVGSCIQGLTSSGPQKTSDLLGPILSGLSISANEQSAVLVFSQRGSETVVTIPARDVGGKRDGFPDAIGIKTSDPSEIPTKVSVTYLTAEENQEQGSVSEELVAEEQNVVVLDLPLTLETEIAENIAREKLYAAQVENKKVTWTLPPRFMHLQPGDIVVLPDGPRALEVLITSTTRGNDFSVELEGVRTDRSLFEHSTLSSGQSGQAISNSTDLNSYVFELPALISEVSEKVCYYFVANRFKDAQIWRGCALYVADSPSSEFAKKEVGGSETTMGVVETPLSTTAAYWQWDTESTLTVELDRGSLSGCSDSECVSGKNRAAIRTSSGEWEIIGFASVVQLSTKRFLLSRLLRGLRGTEHLISGHLPGQPFVVLELGRVGVWAQDLSSIGSVRYCKVPSLGSLVASAQTAKVSTAGLGVRPFSPFALTASRGFRNKSNWKTWTDGSVSANSGSNTYTGSAGAFSQFSAASVVSFVGWSNSSNNGKKTISSVSANGATMTVTESLVSESSSGRTINVVEGAATDITISWGRRTRDFVGCLSKSGVLSGDTPLSFVLQARKNGKDENIYRTWNVSDTKVVYDLAQQSADGLSQPHTLHFTLKQVSSIGLESPSISGEFTL